METIFAAIFAACSIVSPVSDVVTDGPCESEWVEATCASVGSDSEYDTHYGLDIVQDPYGLYEICGEDLKCYEGSGETYWTTYYELTATDA